MPSDLVKRIDLDLIYPPFYTLVFELLARCRAKGKDYWAIDGFRTEGQQQALYNQGRLTKSPSADRFPPLGKPVTNARPWQSTHNYGLAIDFALDKDTTKAGLQPDWRLSEYQLLADEAVALGLKSLYYSKTFREGPHVELNLESKGITLPVLKDIWRRKGREGVWTFLDSKGPW